MKYHIAFQALHANMNELIVFQNIAICNVSIAFGSSLYRFRWFGATFKKKNASHTDFFINTFASFSDALMMYFYTYLYVLHKYAVLQHLRTLLSSAVETVRSKDLDRRRGRCISPVAWRIATFLATNCQRQSLFDDNSRQLKVYIDWIYCFTVLVRMN